MKEILMPAAILASAFSLNACSTVTGAAVGGAAGAVVAAATGENVKKGAVIGGATGAVVGTVAD